MASIFPLFLKAFVAKAYPIHTVLRSSNIVTDLKKNSTASTTKPKGNNLDFEISADEDDYEKTKDLRRKSNNLIGEYFIMLF